MRELSEIEVSEVSGADALEIIAASALVGIYAGGIFGSFYKVAVGPSCIIGMLAGVAVGLAIVSQG